MSKPPGILLFLLASTVFAAGCVGGGWVGASQGHKDPGRVIYAPFPHHVAPTADAASFRFAMVHDVIHERYPRHGAAYYAERERLARERIADLHPDSETAFALTDDIAVGLDRRGRTDEAIALMRDKLKRQQALKLEEKYLYSTYANLGEFLVHANMWAMCSGDAVALQRAEEGRRYLGESIRTNPNAHFGREKWQLVAIAALVDASKRPAMVQQCDLVGNRLDLRIEFRNGRGPRDTYFDGEQMIARPYRYDWPTVIHFEGSRNQYTLGLLDPAQREEMRRYIAEVGGEFGSNRGNTDQRGQRAPFDEPSLWLIGEWRQGSGPNPHSALCLGEIMLRVGQRYLAWSCYERASRLADKFWPSPEAREFLRDHCRRRQTAIENSLPRADVATLRPQFESELTFGEKYQQDYQAYTDEKIQAGANLNDVHFFDEFHATRGSVASKVGPEEWYAATPQHEVESATFQAFLVWGLLSGGACLLLAAIISTWVYRPQNRLGVPEITPPPSPAPGSPPAFSDPAR